MKKNLLAAIFACAAMFGFSAPTVTAAEKVSAAPGEILIAYYSWGGNTKSAAEQIKRHTNGTLFAITPVKPYSQEYAKCLKAAKEEIKAGVRPALSAQVADLNKYDVIFVGSPNWLGTIAPPVVTFLTTIDLKGKTIIPFFTHGGGGMQNCERDIRKLCSQTKVLKAGAFSGKKMRTPSTELANWLRDVITIQK